MRNTRHFRIAGIGAAAGGMLVAGFAQLAVAHADEITNSLTDTSNAAAFATAAAAPATTDIFTAIQADVQSDITLAQSDLTAAVTDFSGQNVPGGLEQLLAGLDNLLYAPGQTVGIDAIDYLFNGQDFGPVNFLPGTAPAADLTAAFSQIQADYTTYGPADLSQALTYLEQFNLGAVLYSDFAFDDYVVFPMRSLLIGSVDQLIADGASTTAISSGLGEFATLLLGSL